MPYTRMSLAIVWLLVAALVGVSMAGMAPGFGLVLLVVTALVAPALLLRGTRKSS